MSNFTDSQGVAPGFIIYDLVSGETSAATVFKAVAGPGRTLQSGASSLVALMARETDSGDPFTDLADGIDLSSYAEDEVVSFDVVAVATSGVGRRRGHLFLGVTEEAGAAGWTDAGSAGS